MTKDALPAKLDAVQTRAEGRSSLPRDRPEGPTARLDVSAETIERALAVRRRLGRGFHHHVVLVAVAHAFLAIHRALSPSDEVDAAAGETVPSRARQHRERLPGAPESAPHGGAATGPRGHARARGRARIRA